MRQIVLDTETTGLEPENGDRIIEIGCVEVINRRKTDRDFHQYLNPDHEIDDGAFNVHGISNEFLSDKPRFADIAQDLIGFIRDSELIIHNAPFDVSFLDAEFELIGKGKTTDYCTIKDTLLIARESHPGQKNNLDALCKRYEIDHSQRNLHGALLDAQLLLEVYLKMTSGQDLLGFDELPTPSSAMPQTTRSLNPERNPLPIILPTTEELAAHEEQLARIKKESGGKCIWLDRRDD